MNILVIPHHPYQKRLRLRLTEMAKPLQENHTVYFLNWRSVEEDYTLKNRIISNLKDLFKKPLDLYELDGFRMVEMPTLHRPFFLARKFNGFWLDSFIRKKNIDVVVNGVYEIFPMPEKRTFKYIYDLADYPPEGFNAYTLEEVRKADTCTVVSSVLAEYMMETYQVSAVPVPNGAHIRLMNSVTQEEIDTIRKKYGIEHKIVLGYIGYIGAWVNIDLVVEAFKLFKKAVPNAVLLWIGRSPELTALKNAYESDDIIFTGGVDNIETYFRALDIGLLPHRESIFQDSAFHLKLVEYTAAHKPAVCTRLKESMRLGFPNLFFAMEKPEEWAAAFQKAHSFIWKKEYDTLTDKYDWEMIAKQLESLLGKQ
jgi:glycosyltransferase involved in cell wall biosynthesis